MENQPNTISTLFEDASDYLDTRVNLLKLQAVDKSSTAASSVLSGLIIIVAGLFALALLNIGLAFWIGEALGKVYLGFFILAGFYALVGLLLHFFKRSWIKEPISNALIKKFLE